MSNEEILETHLEYIRRDITEIKGKLDHLSEKYITKEEFEPIKKIVYGLVGLCLLGVAGSVVTLVIK